MVPSFDLRFEVSEIFLELVHFGAFGRDKALQSRVDHGFEGGVVKPESFKFEGPFQVDTRALPLKRDRLMVRTRQR